MKTSISGPASVRATLERIRREAVAKAQEGISERRKKARDKADPVAAVVRQLRAGIRGATATEVSRRMGRKVTEEFLTTFQDAISNAQRTAQQRTGFASATRKPDGDLLMYPEGCRFMYLAPTGRGVAVVEQPPKVRTIFVGLDQKHVPMPYVVFVVYFNKARSQFSYAGIQVGFSLEPIRSPSDVLLVPPLPNHSGHHVCMGGYQGHSGGTPNEVIEGVIGQYWQSVFEDRSPSFSLNGKQVRGWAAWERIANGNPLDILKARFERGQSVEYLIRHVGNDAPVEDQRAIQQVLQRLYSQVSDEMDLEYGETLVQLASQELLNKLLDDLTLQPQESE